MYIYLVLNATEASPRRVYIIGVPVSEFRSIIAIEALQRGFIVYSIGTVYSYIENRASAPTSRAYHGARGSEIIIEAPAQQPKTTVGLTSQPHSKNRRW